ncbi:MAG: ATP-binding protein, partial [Desulfobacterales bacterium]|nr:ATP-binding protein [Desulfobacterales bacterium]
MKSIIETCEPRQDIVKGTFNPEIFTASLSEVLRYYAGHKTNLDSVYTQPDSFFSEATYPTDGMKMLISEVFTRLSGDHTVPAIHRLETAFGGGKTHTLIACAHIAYKGTDIASVTSDVLPNALLPKPGEITVVGIAGEEIPVHKPKGSTLIPYTLWGEIAFQIGGKALYQEVENDAVSHAAPGKNYFDTIFQGKKVLIMLDELAQYTARLSAVRSDGSDQLAAFLMSLHGYARSHQGISILLTLASSQDAFASQTEQLVKLLTEVTGKKLSRDAALGIGQQAIGSVTSVVSRDATAIVPVQASEISRVLAKRLFTQINRLDAEITTTEYIKLYQKNSSMLPNEASRLDYKEIMLAHYPFHPTLINFLNYKLAVSENFQRTRGILRVLALTVRNVWNKKTAIPMIHACHFDLRDARIVNELIGRTGSGDLLPVLNADIGSVDTHQIEGGQSNAELADQRNPHPEQWPMYEYTWKTIFLHSLIGRDLGLGSNLFGLTESDALFHVSFPGLTPPQIAEALNEITNSAFYLRFNQGRY